VRGPIETDRLPDQVYIAREAPIPEVLGEDERSDRCRVVIVLSEHTADYRRRPERLEEVLVHPGNRDPLGILTVRNVAASTPVETRGLEQVRTRGEVLEVRVRNAEAVAVFRGVNANQTLAVFHRKRPQQRRFGQAEDRGGCADSDRERHDREQRESRTLR